MNDKAQERARLIEQMAEQCLDACILADMRPGDMMVVWSITAGLTLARGLKTPERAHVHLDRLRTVADQVFREARQNPDGVVER